MENTLKNMRKNEKGFTLVELAVVMIIIGVLIGGVLKGQEMITNARVTSTASDLQSFQAAYNSFYDQYNIEPGDMSLASTRLPNCGAACAATVTSNGYIDNEMGAVPTTDGVAFFGQLLDAGYISGMDGSSATAAPGTTNPNISIPGGVLRIGDYRDPGTHVGFTNATNFNRPYIYIEDGVAAATGDGTGVLTPLQAANIDRRLDDGNPLGGIVIAANGTSTSGCGSSAYNESLQNENCAIAYRM